MPRPNVVFVIADQHRWDFMGGGDNGVTLTPQLDALGRRATICHSAYCTAPLCSPSRAALAAGRYGVNTGCFTNLHELPPGTPSFVGQLRAAGYRTSAVGKTHMEIHAYDSDYTSPAHRAYMDSLGWDEVCEISGNGMLKTGIRCAYTEYLREAGRFDDAVRFYRQWRYFMDPGRTGDPDFVCHRFDLPEECHETAFVGRRAVEWLERWDASRPFFLHVGFAAPHSPVEPLPRCLELYRDHPESEPWGEGNRPAWLADGRRGYRAMITEVDEWVGRLVAAVAGRGWLDDTVFVYVADHGEMAGDHGACGKTCFHEGSVRVPLLLAGPGIAAGRETAALVELVDLGKTVCELCGVEPHAWDQGRSLAPLLRGETEGHRDTVYSEMGCDRMLFDGRFKLMWGDPRLDTRQLGRLHLDKPANIPPSPGRLYDLLDDPHELHDLAGEPGARGLLRGMLEKLLARANQNVQTQPARSRGEYRPP